MWSKTSHVKVRKTMCKHEIETRLTANNLNKIMFFTLDIRWALGIKLMNDSSMKCSPTRHYKSTKHLF